MMSISSDTASAFSKMLTARRWKDALRGLSLSVAICATGSALVGCWSVPNVLTTPDNPVAVAKYFPSALLAEPIELREGYTHTTQPFPIKSQTERWDVALGFVRMDQALSMQQKRDGAADTCWTDSAIDPTRLRTCTNANPGFNLKWDLLRADGTIAGTYTHDSLIDRGGGTYAGNAITRTLSGFSNQAPGQYRLRITVLRDARELNFLKPHVVVEIPFFRRK